MDNNTGVKWSSTLTMEGLQKSAIIYRKSSACFIYVCFHCGRTFDEVTETLQHIESHFQLANVAIGPIGQFTDDGKADNSSDCFDFTSVNSNLDIKLEVKDQNDIDGDFLLKSEPQINEARQEFRCKICNSIESTKFSIRIHALIKHIHEPMKCTYCNKSSFTEITDFESHLKTHIIEGDVNWKNVAEGIHSTVNVDWSAYYEAIETVNEQQDSNALQGNSKTGLSTHARSNSRRNRHKQTTKREYSRPYRCHKCSQSCRTLNLLKSHYAKHADEDLQHAYRCKECDIYHKNAYALRTHVLQTHRMMEKFGCMACGLEFDCSQVKQFEEHLQLHNGPDNKLWSDIRGGIHHEPGDFTQYEDIDLFTEEMHCCEFCTQRFYIKSNFDVHMKTVHSSQRRLPCSQCDSIFTTPKYYYAHQLEHQRVGATIIERDDNVLLGNLDACIDERIIFEENEFHEKVYRCLICNTAFDGLYDLRSHIRERHVYKMFPAPVEPSKEFICDLCGIRLKTKKYLRNHFLIHANIKKHPCTICGKMFRQNSDRRIHERQHTGEKPYQCHECGKAFISKGLLTAHKKNHENRTYPCHICGKVFRFSSGYSNHVKTHRVERDFECTVCSKTFNTKIYLTRHMAIHSDRKHKCHFCDSTFNTGDGRRQHQRHRHKYEMSLPM